MGNQSLQAEALNKSSPLHHLGIFCSTRLPAVLTTSPLEKSSKAFIGQTSHLIFCGVQIITAAAAGLLCSLSTSMSH